MIAHPAASNHIGPMPRVDPLRTTLRAGAIGLAPFADSHRDGLRAASAEDAEIWHIYPYSMLDEHFDPAIEDRLATPGVFFTAFKGDAIVGTTMYLRPDIRRRSLEIGGSYIVPRLRGSGYNAMMKRLMIGHAFACGFVRIEFRVDARNLRSRAAVLKLGAVHEDTLSGDRVTWTGHRRDTCLFALHAQDWKP